MMGTRLVAPLYTFRRKVAGFISDTRRHYSKIERAARRVPSFLMLPRVMHPSDIGAVAKIISKHRRMPECLGQSGFVLDEEMGFGGRFSALTKAVNRLIGFPMRLNLAMSSCRVQEPRGYGALALHQDAAALGVDPLLRPCCTIWLPLCSIDDKTPTLEVARMSPRVVLVHGADANGYSILPLDYPEMPLMAFTKMNEGDAVLLAGTTLHRTCIRPWHDKIRMSVDLRFLPMAVK